MRAHNLLPLDSRVRRIHRQNRTSNNTARQSQIFRLRCPVLISCCQMRANRTSLLRLRRRRTAIRSYRNLVCVFWMTVRPALELLMHSIALSSLDVFGHHGLHISETRTRAEVKVQSPTKEQHPHWGETGDGVSL